MENPLRSLVRTYRSDIRAAGAVASWTRDLARLAGYSVARRLAKAIDPRKVQSRTIAFSNQFSPPNEPQPDQRNLSETELHEPVVWVGLETPAEDAASVPLILKEGTPTKPGKVIEDHEVQQFFAECSPMETETTFWRQIYKDLRGAGDNFGFLYLSQRGRPIGYERFLPDTITPQADGKGGADPYTWKTIDAQGRLGRGQVPVDVDIPAQNIWHIKNGSNPETPLRGLGVLARLRWYIRMMDVMQTWNLSRYERGIPQEYLIFFRGQFNEGERAETEARLRQKFGPDGDPWMLIEGDGTGEAQFDIKLFPRPTEDELAFLDSDERIVYRIALAMKIPPAKLMDFSQSTRIANADAMEKLYWQDTIKGMHDVVVAWLNQKFLPRFWPGQRLFFSFDYSGVEALQRNHVQLMTELTGYVRDGIYTRNEARVEKGKEPLVVLDTDGVTNLMDVPMVGNQRLGASPLAGLNLFGGDESEDEPEDETADTDTDTDTDEPEPADTDGNLERARGSIVKLAHVRGQVRKVKMIPHDLIDFELEKEIFDRLVRNKILNMIVASGQAQLRLQGLTPTAFTASNAQALEFLQEMIVKLVEDPNSGVVANTDAMVRARVAESIADGDSIAAMRSAIQDAFEVRREPWQLDRISRTEVHQAQEGGSFLALEEAGAERKAWVTAADSRVRGLETSDQSDHEGIAALGAIPLAMPFEDPRSRAQLMFPGDRRGAVKGSDTINCRCTMVAVFDDDDRRLAITTDEVWYAKAERRSLFEMDLRRTLRAYFVGMEKRALKRFDAQARAELEARVAG